jgi:1-deoxy-D-xylulose-5-phosphate reductoisomerase
VTPADALAHPNFSMGRVITTNSATLVNKGLEVIEAHLLFDIPFEAIEVVVHPQQLIHSMVEFVDGSTIAQAGPPRMLVPIALGLSWPDRLADVDEPVDWTKAQSWEFEPLDDEAFPAVRLARQVGVAGGTYPAVYNAANEVAVDAFHDGHIGFVDIVDTVARVVEEHAGSGIDSGELSVEDVLRADAWARGRARKVLGLTTDDVATQGVR